MITKYNYLLALIEAGGFEAYYVGGCVRDDIWGIEPKDYDICTNAPVSFIEALGGKYISPNHDIDVFKFNDEVEVARFRTEAGYDGRRPSEINYNATLYDDLNRRDFNINAIAQDRHGKNIQGQLFYLNSVKQKFIDFVGNYNDRLTEDNLRLIRFIRFVSVYELKYGVSLKYQLINNICKDDTYLKHIAKERILSEIEKVMNHGGKTLVRFLRMLDEYDILKYIIKPLYDLKGKEHKTKHHPEGDAYEHTLRALEVSNLKGNDLWCVLLHDCGKASTWDSEALTFYKHEHVGIYIIEEYAKEMKFSNDLKDKCIYCCKNHMKFHLLRQMKKSKVYELLNHKYTLQLIATCKADTESRGASYESDLDFINNFKYTTDKFKLAITGKDIIKYTDSGPLVGHILQILKDKVLEGTLENTRDELINEVMEIIYENKY